MLLADELDSRLVPAFSKGTVGLESLLLVLIVNAASSARGGGRATAARDPVLLATPRPFEVSDRVPTATTTIYRTTATSTTYFRLTGRDPAMLRN